MHDVSNNTSPLQISNLFNYQHNIHSHNTRSSTKGNFFLEYSRLDSKTCLFQETVLESRITYPQYAHKLSEANEYIDLLDLNMP